MTPRCEHGKLMHVPPTWTPAKWLAHIAKCEDCSKNYCESCTRASAA